MTLLAYSIATNFRAFHRSNRRSEALSAGFKLSQTDRCACACMVVVAV